MNADDHPDAPPVERAPGIAGMLAGMNETFNDLERYVAGYNTLTRVFQTVTNVLPPGTRPKGLMLSFKGSVDDIHAIDVNIDIQKQVDPQNVHLVLVPLANGQAMGMLMAVRQLLTEGRELESVIEAALGINQPTTTPAPASQPAAKAV